MINYGQRIGIRKPRIQEILRKIPNSSSIFRSIPSAGKPRRKTNTGVEKDVEGINGREARQLLGCLPLTSTSYTAKSINRSYWIHAGENPSGIRHTPSRRMASSVL